MKRIATFLPGLFLAWLVLFTAHANQGTRVTSGALTFASHVGHIDVSGQSGFTIDASVDSASGIFAPENQWSDLDCGPGTQVNLAAHWVGNDLRGGASLRGGQSSTPQD